MLALARRTREGGTYRVRVSLCQSAMLIQRQGLISGFEDVVGRLDPEEIERYAVADDATAYGGLKGLGPVIRMSGRRPTGRGRPRAWAVAAGVDSALIPEGHA